ncbi:flagellar basal body rod protein FlgB [Undibacterium sp. TJN25]|uniref:flagellar basal body rod protein FlgB n=1 Tax=Undibacterium sp. TJN25 TaxID=3413056 RepID=UPI003BEF8677
MISIIDNNTTKLLSLALDASTLRHQAIAQNIANVNTPGYQAMGVSFESRLSEARRDLEQGQSVSLDDLTTYRPTLEPAEENFSTGGAVTLEMELAKLSENTLHHQAVLKALTRHFSIINSAINEGKS